MTISSDGILEFTFDNIMLPSITEDEIASRGFITFQVKQKEGNAIGTQINNQVSVYLDFDYPITTNSTFHTIGENQLITVIKDEIRIDGIDIQVFPNPFHEEAIFRISHQTIQKFNFSLYDITGKRMMNQSIGNEFIFQRNNISNGIYFYRIQNLNGQDINAGKIIIQ